MPVQRTPISVSQLADLVGVEPARFIAIEKRCTRQGSTWYVVTEPEDDMAQVSGAFPQLNTGKKSGKKAGKKGCGY